MWRNQTREEAATNSELEKSEPQVAAPEAVGKEEAKVPLPAEVKGEPVREAEHPVAEEPVERELEVPTNSCHVSTNSL
jgi:hypothetical protein